MRYNIVSYVNEVGVMQMTHMDIINILESVSRNNNGLILTKTAEANGVSRAMLSKLSKNGTLSRITVGQYVFDTELGDEMLSLSRRSGLVVFSHESALFLNGLSERTPFEHTVTIPSSKKLSASIGTACKVYYVKDELVSLGKTTLKTALGNPVPAYDPERTVCDIIRSRSRIADETFLTSLKLYAASPKKNLTKLSVYAKAFGITDAVRKYMEVLL
jgi:predicted transcriptional regulator of viral defense system